MPTTISVLRNYADFLAFESEWQALFDAAERPWPYLRHSWLRASWEQQRSRLSRLRVVLVHEDDQLMMAGAFLFGIRRLRPFAQVLGGGIPQVEDVLWRPSGRTAIHAAALLDGLRQEGVLPRTLRFSQLRADSPLLGAIEDAGLTRRRRESRPAFSIPVADYPDFTIFMHSTGHNLRPDHGRRLRRLTEAEGYQYRHETGQAGLEALGWLFDTKRAWLEDKQERAGWLKSGHIDQFLRRALSMPDAPPWFVASLRLNERIIAASLCFTERGQWVFSKVAHDPAEHRYSPGRTLTLMLVEAAFAAGHVTSIDLGTTGENWKHKIAPARTDMLAKRVRLR